MNNLLDFVKENYRYENGNFYRLKSSGGEKVGNLVGWTTVCNGKLYKKMNINKKTYYQHQLIYLYHHGFIPKYIDHIDRNSLNNNIENLRESTQSQNCANKHKNTNNTSGFKGVTFNKRNNKWQAQIMVQYKHIILGFFDNVEDGAKAYEIASKKYFAEFACS
jgi:hypothetical protein